MKKLFILLILFSAFSCKVIEVSSVYDEKKDFSKYKTYALDQEVFELYVAEQYRDYFRAAIDDKMADEGLTKSSDPDMLVNVLLAGEKFSPVTEAANSFYYHGFTQGTLVLSFIDEESRKIIWQGTGTKSIVKDLPESKVEANINNAIKQILKDYPPKN